MLPIGIWIFVFCPISGGQCISVDSGLVAEALFLIMQVKSAFVFDIFKFLSQLPAMALRLVKCWSGRQVGTRLSRSWRFLAPALGEANMHGKFRDKGCFCVHFGTVVWQVEEVGLVRGFTLENSRHEMDMFD